MTNEESKKQELAEYYKDIYQPDPENLLPLDIHIARSHELIDDFYPGRDEITDDELLREKYYSSLFDYQKAVATKRLIEYLAIGMVSGDKKYEFNFFGKGI